MTSRDKSGGPPETGLWSVRETADAFGVSQRALRLYDGLLKPQIERGERQYDARSRIRLSLILKGQQLGFSLEEMAAFMAGSRQGAGGLLRKEELARHIVRLETQRAQLDDTIEELRQTLQTLLGEDDSSRH